MEWFVEPCEYLQITLPIVCLIIGNICLQIVLDICNILNGLVEHSLFER